MPEIHRRRAGTATGSRSVIERFSLFSDLTPEDRAALEGCLHTRTYPGRVLVVSEGDDTRSLYLILEGRVKVFTGDEQGREALLCTQGPGEYFGEVSLFDDAGRSASVMTLERTRLATLVREDLLRCMQAHPGIALAVIRELTGRVRRLTEQVRDLALLDVYGRLTRLLLTLAQSDEGRLVIEPRPTHQQLASRIGASREMVTRILGDLVRGGYVQMDSGRMVLAERFPRAW
jgi:CRP/FNR family transcriptional regulator, cyclic AMP receptor protein